ncbi:dolichyl-phosphate beta-glucosyltransferase [Patescibacteria group bacterium]
MKTISIVIPAYNEEKNIRLGALDKVMRYKEHLPNNTEIIIVNDGSTDATNQLLDSFSKENKDVKIIHNPHQGKGATVVAGMLAASKEIVIFTDLDQATPISQLEKLLPWFDSGYDIVIGSRNQKREGAPLLRLVMARGFMFLRTFILGLHGINDTQCGFKAFKNEVAKKIFQKLKLYGQKQKATGSMVTAGFDIEVLFLGKKLGYKIKEVPVEWHYVETRRVNPIKDSWQGLVDIVIIRINAIFGLYQ